MRAIIKQYEEATASKLHDGKTQVLMLGSNRQAGLSNQAIGVEFNIMAEEDAERYLGDLVGHAVNEETRFAGAIGKMEKVAQQWSNLHTKVYGRAIVANSIMLAQVLYRGQVNVVSTKMRERAKSIITEFMRQGKKKGIQWEKLLLPIEEGGVGLRDLSTALDTQMIRVLKLMSTKADQPWVK